MTRVTCPACGREGVSLVSGGKLRAHKRRGSLEPCKPLSPIEALAAKVSP